MNVTWYLGNSYLSISTKIPQGENSKALAGNANNYWFFEIFEQNQSFGYTDPAR